MKRYRFDFRFTRYQDLFNRSEKTFFKLAPVEKFDEASEMLYYTMLIIWQLL